MGDEPADVPARAVGDERVPLLVEEQVGVAGPQRLVNVHPRAVVAEQRLRHERGRIAQVVADILDYVFVRHQPVGRLYQRAEAEVDLRLSRRAHLVVLHFYGHAGIDQRQHDLRAHVLHPPCGADGVPCWARHSTPSSRFPLPSRCSSSPRARSGRSAPS